MGAVGSLDMEAEPAAKEAADAADHVQYFSSYESLYQQKSMLEDHVRMKAYFDSIMENKACFEGRSVLDVGAGTGILSIWAAKAGLARYTLWRPQQLRTTREI